LKALEELASHPDHNERTVAIYTDRLASLSNNSIHSLLIVDIRNKVRQLTEENWVVNFGWVKAHSGTEGNELADHLAKEAAEDEGVQHFVYDRTPLTTVATDLKKEGLAKWQKQWQSTDKGQICRSFFPTVEHRLKLRIPITAEFTAIVSGHGKTKAYLHRFNIIDNPLCPCKERTQTPNHLIYDCTTLQRQRNTLKYLIKASGGTWPTTNSDLVAKHSHAFSRFIKSIDFEKLQ